MSKEEAGKSYEDLKRVFSHIIMADKDYAKAFEELEDQAEKEGALSAKTKRLMSIAISVVSHCEYCIAYHVKVAIDLGATRKEIMETAMLAGMMGGGPAGAHIVHVIDACDYFGAK